MPNIENLNIELKKLSEIVMKLQPWVERGLLDYRILESQHSEQLERNASLRKENDLLDDKIRKAIQSGEMIVAEARKDEQKIRAESQIFWTKAQSKFKEVEQRIEEADRKVIKSMLKDMEKVT